MKQTNYHINTTRGVEARARPGIRLRTPLIFIIAFLALTTILLISTISNKICNSSLAIQPTITKEYGLAYRQSYGFFTDIADENWKIAQRYHAALFPNYFVDLNLWANKAGDRTLAHKWNAENFHLEFVCPLARRLPPDGNPDGAKFVCDPHRLAKQESCLVYSVGSNGKTEFEEAVRKEIGDHCEIHTFDFDKVKPSGNSEEKLKKLNAHFHQWGLGTKETVDRFPTRFKTLQQTVEELGHQGRVIDIFKIDCEWCEWDTWSDWLTVDMRQILVETHTAPMPRAKDFFFNLHDAGFVIFSKEANYLNVGRGVEFGFIKLSTEFFVNNTMYKMLDSKQ